MVIKVLNLYAGIGGNRKLWKNVDVTAVEIDKNIADIYKEFFPEDEVIVEDAHKFLLENFSKFDFIWSSPPCPTHSRMRMNHKKKVYPDMRLYQEIIFLKHHFKGKWIVENVLPYYNPLIEPKIIHRHAFWSNFKIPNKTFKTLKTCKVLNEREVLQKEFGFNLDKFNGVDKRLLLRNCVVPELGLHIFNSAYKSVQKTIINPSTSATPTLAKQKEFNMGLEVTSATHSSPKLSPTEITSPNPNIKLNLGFSPITL